MTNKTSLLGLGYNFLDLFLYVRVEYLRCEKQPELLAIILVK